MEERTGVDHLSLALLIISILLFIIGKLTGWGFFTWISLVPLVLCYYRALSKNKLKRHQENILFLKYWYPVQSKWINKYREIKAKAQYKYFKCPECHSLLKLPRKVGEVTVTCGKCRHQFKKKA